MINNLKENKEYLKEFCDELLNSVYDENEDFFNILINDNDDNISESEILTKKKLLKIRMIY